MKVSIFVVLVLLAGCASAKPNEDAKEMAATSAGVLFTVDGITVYRFGDGGRYHYFAVQTGRPDTVTFSDWEERCGKNCTRHLSEQISTSMAAR